MTTPRVFLGRDRKGFWGVWVTQITVYMLPDALEVDETTFIEIERTRVYFDDVLAITYHRGYSVLLLALAGGFGALFALFGIMMLTGNEKAGSIGFFIFAMPFLLTCAAHLFIKYTYITVFGRRTMARMKFTIRKGRARQVYKDLIAKIRAHQAALAAAQPKPPPPAEPELPPGPPPLPGVEPLPPAGPLL
jgi:hypothetical protein